MYFHFRFQLQEKQNKFIFFFFGRLLKYKMHIKQGTCKQQCVLLQQGMNQLHVQQAKVVEGSFLSRKCEIDSAHICDQIFRWIFKFVFGFHARNKWSWLLRIFSNFRIKQDQLTNSSRVCPKIFMQHISQTTVYL